MSMTSSTPFYKSGDDYLPNNTTLELGATGTRIAKIWCADGDFTSITIGTLTTGITNTQVVYSDSGVLAGDTGMTWTKATDTLTIGGAAFKGGTNTFNILNGTAQLDVAAATSVNFDAGLQVTTNAGILAFTGSSKTLNVEDTATVSQDYSSDATPTFAGLALGSGDVTTTGAIGRDTDNEINWGTDDSLALVIGGTTSNIVSISTGTGDNDKLVTQGYVDDAIPAEGASKALDNLASVALNTALLPDAAAADDFGSATLPFKDLWIAGSSGTPATNNFQITGASTSGTRVITLPDATATLAANDQTFYIGTTQVAINRASAALTLAGITLTTPNIGTPSAGTLTSCTGLPLTGLVDDTTTALGVGSIELGHASDTTLSRSDAGVLAVESVVVPTVSSTNTLTNKRITSRVATFTSDATPDVNSDNYDAVTITAQAEAITDVNVTGTPTNFQKLIFRILDNGTGRAITWGDDFEAKGVDLPTTTTASKVLTVGFIYDTVTSKWGCVAVVDEANES